MKKKTAIICMAICLLMTAIIIGAIVLDVEQAQQQTEPDNDTSKSDEMSENEDSYLNIPDINEIPDKPDNGSPDIDVSEMTRNPEPEVFGSEVEYGTKESESNEE